jgi:hypothetical protein
MARAPSPTATTVAPSSPAWPDPYSIEGHNASSRSDTLTSQYTYRRHNLRTLFRRGALDRSPARRRMCRRSIPCVEVKSQVPALPADSLIPRCENKVNPPKTLRFSRSAAKEGVRRTRYDETLNASLHFRPRTSSPAHIVHPQAFLTQWRGSAERASCGGASWGSGDHLTGR